MRSNESAGAPDATIQPHSTAGQSFYRRQIALLEAANVDDLMSQYHEDACLVTFDAVVEGRAAIGAYLQRYLNHLGGLKLRSTDRFAETRDAIFFEATVATGLGEARVQDVFMLRQGKATHHFAGVVSSTPGEAPAPRDTTATQASGMGGPGSERDDRVATPDVRPAGHGHEDL